MVFRSLVLLVGLAATLNTFTAAAQDIVLGQKYGQGVHAFFTGDYLKAHEELTSAIQGGSKDPRAYYFRGLANLKLGRSPEAIQDFRKGAQLETGDVNRFYNVSKALERVQGMDRVTLENYRVDARMAAMERAERLRKARYEAIRREESRVLRQKPLVEPPELIETPSPSPVAAPESEAADEAKSPVEKPAAKVAPKKEEKKEAPAAEKPAANDNPFGEAPAAEEKPAEQPAEAEDPFAQ